MENTQEYNIYELTDLDDFEVKEILHLEKNLSGYEKTLVILRSYQEKFQRTVFSQMVVCKFSYCQHENSIELGIDERFLKRIEKSESELNIVKSFNHTIKELCEINTLKIGTLL